MPGYCFIPLLEELCASAEGQVTRISTVTSRCVFRLRFCVGGAAFSLGAWTPLLGRDPAASCWTLETTAEVSPVPGEAADSPLHLRGLGIVQVPTPRSTFPVMCGLHHTHGSWFYQSLQGTQFKFPEPFFWITPPSMSQSPVSYFFVVPKLCRVSSHQCVITWLSCCRNRLPAESAGIRSTVLPFLRRRSQSHTASWWWLTQLLGGFNPVSSTLHEKKSRSCFFVMVQRPHKGF